MSVVRDRMDTGCCPEAATDFAELDEEIERYAVKLPSTSSIPSPDDHPGGSLLKRLFGAFRGTKTDKKNEAATAEGRDGTITCRICEKQVAAGEIEAHTNWCSRYQESIIRKEICEKYLQALSQEFEKRLTSTSTALLLGLHEVVHKARSIDEEEGKPATVRLTRLQYKLSKIDSTNDSGEQQALRRVKYLVEQKRLLAERFAELCPQKLFCHHDLSSATDSSLDTTPSSAMCPRCFISLERPSTPVARLTTLLSAMLRKPRSASRSPQFGASPPRPSHLRATIPQISDFEILKPISRGAYGYGASRLGQMGLGACTWQRREAPTISLQSRHYAKAI